MLRKQVCNYGNKKVTQTYNTVYQVLYNIQLTLFLQNTGGMIA